MNIQQSAVRKSTRAEVLLNEIEQMIVDGIILPGEKLDETVLANKFGVSRTPVREAIRALTAIGLVENAGRQGAEVSQVSVSMLIEMFELMAVLEGMCAQLAARRATQDDKLGMNATHEHLKSTFESGNHKEFYNVNLKFHDQLYAAAHTQFLAGQAHRLRRRLSPYRMRVTYQAAAVLPNLDDGNQYMNHFLAWDVIESPDIGLRNGKMAMLWGPGLGFELNLDAVARAHELYNKQVI